MKRLLKFTVCFFLVIVLLVAGTLACIWYIWSSNLPYIGSLKEYRPPIITEIFSDDGEVIGRFWEEKRVVVALDQVPDHLIRAFVAAEDARFFEHEGVDIKSIIRAFFVNLTAGKIEQGGSTITQQVTKSLLLKNTQRTYRRKVREALLSVQLEKTFSKEQILFLYLNQIYLGHGAYGVEAAAQTYFGKPAMELDIAESALLAGLPQAPARYSPVSHFERAKARQKYVLKRMHEEGYINESQLVDALNAELGIQATEENTFAKAPHFTEHVRRYLLEKYGRDFLYRGGLKVYTTLNLDMQVSARNAIKKGLLALDRREGYRGPVKHLIPEGIEDFKVEALERFASDPPQAGSVVEAIVEEVNDNTEEVLVWIGEDVGYLPFSGIKWARKPNIEVPYYAAPERKPSDIFIKGDVILVRLLEKATESSPEEKVTAGRQESLQSGIAWKVALEQGTEIEGALFCMVPETGEVKAMIGGKDFAVSQFNRAVQSRRQPGSAFKPLIYAAALDWGMDPGEIIVDAPYISDDNPDDRVWKPKNYKEKFFGPTLFRSALAKSRNVITVKILRKIGVRYAIEYARNMGIESPLSPDLSLALGSSGVSLMEITRAYSVFANGGMLVRPIFVNRIMDRRGQIIEENQPKTTEVIPKETAFIMTDLLKAVIQEGTGWRIKALRRPVAGKTGTTNNMWDAWFIGYTPGLATGVWVGYDDRKAMGKGETGSRAASPIWLSFMSDVLKDRPVLDFPIPEGVVFAKIDAETGFLAGPYSQKTVFQSFRDGHEPKEYSPKAMIPKSGQFFQFDMDDGAIESNRATSSGDR